MTAVTASHSGAWGQRDRSAVTDAEAVEGSWRHYEPLQLPPVLRHSLVAFAEHGYHGTSVREIAKRLGQTVPAIYYHYDNKQALLVTLLQGSMQEVLQRSELALREAGDDPVRRFVDVITCVVLYVGHRRQLMRLDAEMRSLEPDNRSTYVGLRDELEAHVVAAVRDGRDQGRFVTPYPVEAARAVLTMCIGIATWYDPEGPLGPADIADRYVAFALGLVGGGEMPG